MRPLSLLALFALALPLAHADDVGVDSVTADVPNVTTDINEAGDSAAVVDAEPALGTVAAPTVSKAGKFYGEYAGILYGPSVAGSSVYRPTPQGKIDRESPMFARNFMTAGYDVSDDVSISGTGYWIWAATGKKFSIQDPYVQISDSSYFSRDEFNAYGDFRVHFPASDESRDRNMLIGLQSFHILSYQPEDTRFTFLSSLSARYSYLGKQGYGDDLELYAAPSAQYLLAPKVSASLTYQMGASHAFGQKPFHFNNDGTELSPGVIWSPIPSLVLNPYLSFSTGGRLALDTTTFNLYVNWQLI